MTGVTGQKDRVLVYEGSVKRLWQSPERDDVLWFEFSDDYSIFDWGKMPDTVKNKGLALTLLGRYFFRKLETPKPWWNELRAWKGSEGLKFSPHLEHMDHDWLSKRFDHPVFKELTENGLATHFLRLTDGEVTIDPTSSSATRPLYMEVRRAKIPEPERAEILGNELYFYPDGNRAEKADSTLFLVPLEVVFRFGMPQGSSLKDRIAKNPAYIKQLGLCETPEESSWFPHPTLEFFSKLEPTDRLLAWQEAVLISGLSPAGFEEMVEKAFAISLALYSIFRSRSIELWDGKLEFVVEMKPDGSQEVLLADSIGPDELRLRYRGCHLSKELIRQLYKGSPWEVALAEAKKLARKDPSRGFKERCISDLKQQPQPLDSKIKPLVDQLYPVVANHVIGEELIPCTESLDSLVDAFAEITGKAD